MSNLSLNYCYHETYLMFIEHLHGTGDLKTFTNGRITSQVRTIIQQPQNLFANLVINPPEKSNMHLLSKLSSF